ncbi:MAG TPA: amino acid adenylation domain-containing protein [Candidatus Angelobacter sp.]|nr:amino acid adenylation domain-containing protein [Candidatus Angelobacter sp.]
MKLNKEEYAASIAVIGKSGRFPQARNVDEFWQNLSAGREGITFFTEEELLSAGIEPEILRRPNYVRALGYLDGADLFDAQFFGYTPREAQMLDPQQRVFLECAWEALEDAGYASDDPGVAGVYASSIMSSYVRNLLTNAEILQSADMMQVLGGNDKDHVPTRVSYKFNLKGPSISVQTACSSSLVAVHLACRGLLTYECDLALAGGVSIAVPFKEGYLHEEGGYLCSDGHCRAFDAKANGTLMGRGCGVVVLKRLFEAVEDGDSIQAVIRGSAVNNDGSAKVGYTAPSVEGQVAVIRSALAVAQVPSETIHYVEAHGTGTLLGDPIELTALAKAYGSSTGKKAYCAIGSLKTNIGHLDAAAGVAGLIKTIMALEHKALPPSLNFDTPNPKAELETSPFYVNTRLSEWPANGTPRRAGVTSLGIGGTNVHVILEEAPDLDRQRSDRKHHLLVLSAKSQNALESLTGNMADHLQAHPEIELADVAYTLQVGRKPFPYRRAIVCETVPEAIERLRCPNGEEVGNGAAEQRNRPVVFMFPGGGTQYPGMGQEIYQCEQIFRENFDKCTELLKPILGRDLRTLLHGDAREAESAAAELVRPSFALPAIFATEYAMAQLFMSWGIKPESMIGHSLGEYTAACLAGVFSLTDALALVTLRGKLIETLPPGAMLSVYLGEAAITALGLSDVCIAAINGPDNCVISGRKDAIEHAAAILESSSIEFRRLHIEAAGHSYMIDSILDEFRSFLGRLHLSAPQIPFISNLTGIWITSEQAVSPDYWVRHFRQTIRFADGASELLKQPNIVFAELGPGHALGSLMRVLVKGKSVPVISSMKHPHETVPETHVLYKSLGRLWLAGTDVNWKAFHTGEPCHRISLPTYPFERQRYFVESQGSAEMQPVVSRKKLNIADWFYAPSWKQMVGWKSSNIQQSAATPWLVFTGSGKLESVFVDELRKISDQVTVVRAGAETSAFERLGVCEFRIDPANASHYKKLLTAVPAPGNVVHFWSLTGDADEVGDAAINRAFYSLFFLTQAIGEANTEDDKNIWVVSNSLADVFRGDLPSPDKAILLGPLRTIPLEYPNLHSVLVDVGEIDGETVSTLLQCCARQPQSSFLAYRMGRVWIQYPERLSLPPAVGSLAVQQGGVYFITGGLGTIGLTLALHLAGKAEARLVLVDIEAPPERTEWDHLLTIESTPAAVRFRINALRSLEELNTPVLTARADVCNESEIQAVTTKAMETFGAIHGVIHAAGVFGGGIMQFKTPAEIEAVLAPKVKGTRVLERVFRGIDLDFFAACSSLTTIQGEFAQVGSCSANAFLDAFCLNNNFKSSTRTVAIGWDTWLDAGMPQTGTAPQSLEHQYSKKVNAAISREEAVEVFDRILNLDGSRWHVLISTLDLELSLSRTNSASQASENSVAMPELYARPELRDAFIAPRNDIEREIGEIWQSVLGLEAVGVSDNFWELGGHSLMANRVVLRLKEKFKVALPLRAIFEMPTIEQLAEKIAQLRKESVDSRTSSGPLQASEAQSKPIPRVNRQEKLALSYGQERLWFIHELDPENVAYNVPAAVRVQGPLELEPLERALREIVRRHESLRTRFVSVNGEPQQIIDSSLHVELPVMELGHLLGPEREQEAERLALEEVRRPFDLTRGPLLRVKLLRLDREDHVLVLSLHHIVSDAWSVGVLVREVSAVYNHFSTGEALQLPELEIQYADYSAWQRELLMGPVLETQLEYWKRKLAAIEPLMLPTDKPPLPMGPQDGAVIRFTIPVELTETLTGLARKQSATLYMILLAAFQALLCRYTRQYDIAVGSPVAGRSRTEAEPLIGNFINMLVLRTDLSGELDSSGLLQRVKETTLEAYAHQDVPFEKLVEALAPQRDLTKSPLFQVVFNLLNMPWTGLQLGAAKMLPFNLHSGAAQFEISLIIAETTSGLEGLVEYNTALFEAASINRMTGHYCRLLTSIVSAPHAPIHSLDILSTDERRTLLQEFNATATAIPETTVARLFEGQVDRTPNAQAVWCGESGLSYRELNQRANQLAWRLRGLGVGPETRVGLFLKRSQEMVVGILGVLKAGAAYVPLDPDYPPERLSHMLESAQVAVLLTQEFLREQVRDFPVPVLELDGAGERERLAEQPAENLDIAIFPDHLAYIIYTSGSTGKPKGAMNSHGGLANRLLWMQEEYRLKPTDVVLQKTPFSFDVSVWEFLWPLMEGAKLVVARPAGHLDPDYLAALIQEQHVTTLHFVPSMLAVFLNEERVKQCKSLRQVVCSGEALPADLARRCLASMPWVKLHNLYGPTEAAIDVTYWECQAEDPRPSVPIGKPIANIRLYVVDEAMEPVAVGVPGELCLGGVGLARGYWSRGDLTAERFVPDALSGKSGERLYRTGDLVRWLADANVEYLGRLDHQVKIRGFRIELGEIEAALQEHDRVQQAVVIAREDKAGDKRLVAYVVSAMDSETNGSGESKQEWMTELREYLFGKLPEYMVPGAYVRLEKLPLNHNGKIDRKSLPEPDADAHGQKYVPPGNATEEALCRIWEEILHRERVGTQDNFFALGGHSLLAVQIATRVGESFKVNIPLRRMFESLTVAQLARAVDQEVQIAAVNGAPSQLRPAIKRVARKAVSVEVD